MKNSLLLLGLLAVFFVFTGSTMHSVKSAPGTVVSAGDSSSIPSGVFKILDNSCLACHGEGGKPMAMGKLKLSDWDGYSSEKKTQKAAAICKEVTEGTMPPKGFLKNNPGAALTKEQTDSICLWSKSLNPVK